MGWGEVSGKKEESDDYYHKRKRDGVDGKGITSTALKNKYSSGWTNKITQGRNRLKRQFRSGRKGDAGCG